MSRPESAAPSERELDILKVLWRLGEARVRDVHEALCPDGQCAFTTIQTLLRIMATKGLVRPRREGRTFWYAPSYTPQQATSRFLHKVFDGSLNQLVLHMLQAEDVSPQELGDLEQMIAEARRRKQQEQEEAS